MNRYFSPGEADGKAVNPPSPEDPPNDVTKQNKANSKEDEKEKIEVPKEAVEEYKKSGKDTDE